MQVRRYDSQPLSNVRLTAAGTLIVPASVSRTGLQEYTLHDGSKRIEYRPEAEVFAPAALDSLRGATVTIGHTNEPTPQGIGLVSDRDPTRATRDGEQFVETHFLITDQAAIARIAGPARDLTEISLGYDADLDMTPGVLPDGRRYDATQKNIRIHHAAALPRGYARAGKHAKIRVDGNQEICSSEPENTEQMTTTANAPAPAPAVRIKIGDRTFDEGGADHIKFLEGLATAADAARADLQTKLTAALADATAQKARADAAEAQAAAAKQAQPQAVAEELKFRDSVKDRLPKGFTVDGKSRDEIMRAVVGADACKRVDAEPEANRPVYLKSTFDTLLATPANSRPTYEVKIDENTSDQKKDGASAGLQSRLHGAYVVPGAKK